MEAATNATTAPVPDLSWLKELPPGVAYLALATVLVVTVLFYTGPALRERLKPKPPPPPPPPVAAIPTNGGVVATVDMPAVVDHVDRMTDRFVDHLLRQLRDETREREELEREIRLLREENERLRAQQWQRGGG